MDKKQIKEFIESHLNKMINFIKKSNVTVFEKQQEIAPMLFSIKFNNLKEPSINIVDLSVAFSHEDKGLRNIMLANCIKELKSDAVIMLNEAWSLKANNKEELNNIRPSNSPDREEILMMSIYTPYSFYIISAPIISNFQNIKDGIPNKTLGQYSENHENSEGAFRWIFENYCSSLEKIEKRLS